MRRCANKWWITSLPLGLPTPLVGQRRDRAPCTRRAYATSACACVLPEYSQRWHCPVLFNCPANKIVIEKSLLARPLRQPNPELRQTLEQHAHTKLASPRPTPQFKDELLVQVQQLLNDGKQNKTNSHKGSISACAPCKDAWLKKA